MDIDAEFEKFIEFPTESKDYVTTVSAKLFAEHCVGIMESAIIAGNDKTIYSEAKKGTGDGKL